jgi:phosphoglycolate phosphatase
MKKKFQHVLFDLDGTLIDSFSDILNCLNLSLKESNLKTKIPFERSHIGPPLETLAAVQLQNPSPENIALFVGNFRKHYDHGALPNTLPFPGILDLLDSLELKNCNLYIATNKRLEAAVKNLSLLGGPKRFKSIEGRSILQPLSKTEMISKILNDQHLSPSTCVYIGDTEGDMRAASKNQLTSIGVSWGYGSEEELLRGGAMRIFSTPESLGSFLLNPNQ